MSWIVKHKNPKIIFDGSWSIDGEGLNWTKEEAEAHVRRCEFEIHNIEYQITEERKSFRQKERKLETDKT